MYDYNLNLLHPLTLVQHPVVADGDPIHRLLIEEPRTGYVLPDADAYARRLAEEAEAWLDHARDRSRMQDATLVSKALSALAFTMRHRAHDFAVPSKLTGTSKHQPALWRMVKNHVGLGTPLDVEEVVTEKQPRLVVSFDGETLGEVQSKHVPWLRPLLPFGVGVHLVRVTGTDSDYTLGCNVAFGRVGGAVTALNHALGADVGGDGYGGEEASGADAQALTETGRPAVPPPAPVPDHGGDGAHGKGGLRLVSSRLSVAKPQADTEDIALFREIDGAARATVGTRPLEHVIRHSPSGLEWGYHGSGPADLARSILLRFTDEPTADRLYQAFKADVIAAVPRAGGVIPAADVRAYVATHADQR